MGKYFCVQWKRYLRRLPGAFFALLLLLAGLATAFTALNQQNNTGEENQKFQLALCGSGDSSFLKMGLQALESFDSTRFAMTVVQMEEADAADALRRGEIAAYVVIPDTFLQEAFYGNILPLQLVSTQGASGMVSMFKEEITQLITTLLLDAQKGVFGLIDSFQGESVPYDQTLVDNLAIEYMEFVFARNNTFTLRDLSNPNGLTFTGSLLSGLGVLFILLSCLPFAPLLIRQNEALELLLCSKGRPAFALGLCEFAAYALALTAVFLPVGLLTVAAAAYWMPELVLWEQLWDIAGYLLPVILTAAAFSFFLCGLSRDLISGVLGLFFAVLAMAFVCGCIYPTSFFPETLRQMADWLPAGLARQHLAACITGRDTIGSTWLLLGCSGILAGAGSALRVHAKGR